VFFAYSLLFLIRLFQSWTDLRRDYYNLAEIFDQNYQEELMDEQQEGQAQETEAHEEQPEITYHAVEKDGVVTAIWEMQGRKHLRTIDPRSHEGKHILGSHTVDEAAEAEVQADAQAGQ